MHTISRGKKRVSEGDALTSEERRALHEALLASWTSAGRSQTPCRDKPRSGGGSNLAIFLFFEKPLQVDFADGSGGGIKASAHLDLLAHLLNQFRGNVESFRLAVNQHGDLILRVQAFAVGAMTVGLAAGASAFDKRAGQHFAESAEAADEFAAQFQVGFAG